MKKKLAGLLAALLVFSMGTTVFAATSPTAEDIAEAASAASVESATDKSGNGITVSQTVLSSTDYSSAVTAVGSSNELLAAFELTTTSKNFPITVTLAVSSVTSGDSTGTIKVLHYTGSGWETLTPSAVSAGSVTVTLTSLSPVAVIRLAETSSDDGNDNANSNENNSSNDGTNDNDNTGTQTNTNGSNDSSSSSSSGGNTQTNNNYQTVNVYTTGTGASTSTSTSTSTTSPKTGAAVPALPILAVFAVMGIAVCGKKARSL